MVQYKQSQGAGSSTDTTAMWCRVESVDLATKRAIVSIQNGILRTVSLTRMMGKPTSFPRAGETWIITNLFGDWVFAVGVNLDPEGGPPGPQGPQGPAGAFGGFPPGVVVEYAGSNTSVPAGWLICDGSAVSRTTYAGLFSSVGTAYGSGDGSTTFNLPNLAGKVPVGRDPLQTEFQFRGQTGGEKAHQLTIAEMPGHNHTQSFATGGPGSSINDPLARASGANNSGAGVSIGSGSASMSNTGGDGAHNNLQPYTVMYYIVKT